MRIGTYEIGFQSYPAKQVWLIDSFPIALAQQGHRFKAKVAPEIANAGYTYTVRQRNCISMVFELMLLLAVRLIRSLVQSILA